jgi:hypothetical protein
MAQMNFPELNSDLSTSTGDGIRNVANTAANFACSAYKGYANATVGLPDPTGFGSFLNGLYSRLCSPRNQLPPAPTVPFSGGQCPKRYTVNYTLKFKGQSQISNSFFNVLGPIAGVGTEGVIGGQIKYGVQAAPDPPGRPTGFVSAVQGAPGDLNPVEINITSVTPVSGPDNCGDPPPAFPYINPPANVFNNNTTVNIGGGLTIPVGIALIPVLVDANVNINPTINVTVGPFNVTFDAGGVTVAPSFQFSNPTTVSPSPSVDPRSPAPTPTPQPQLPNANCDLGPLITKVTNLQSSVNTIDTTTRDTKTCACPGRVQTQIASVGNGNSGTVALPANTYAVQVAVGTLEANTQGQYGGGSAPDVKYVGWVSFSDGVSNGGERIQLQYQVNYITVPRGAVFMSWTIKGSMVASVKSFSQVPDDSTYELGLYQFKKKPA